MTRTLPLMTLLVVLAPAQQPVLDIELELRGRAKLVSMKASGVTVREMLVHLGAKLGARHRFLPGTPDLLDGHRVGVHVVRMPAGDLVSHLAGAIGLEGHLAEGVIIIRPEPAAGSDEATSWARDRAVSVRTRASLGGDPEHLWQLGLLHLGGGAWAEALSHLERFARVAGSDARAPRALLLASWCGLQAGNEVAGEGLLDRLIQGYTDIQEVMEAWMLKVRLHMDREEWARIPPLLSRIRTGAADPRLRALALLLEAEFWYVQGKGEKAEDTLAAFDVDRRREFPDLAARVPLYEALCLIQAGEYERSLTRLQLCLLGEDPELRVRAALAAARACLHLEQRVAALQNLQIAFNQEPTGRHLIAARLLEAEVYSQLGLGSRALRAYEDAASAGTLSGFGGVDLHILEQTAAILFQRREFAEAREIYSHLVHRKDIGSWAWLQVARCEMGLERHREATEALGRIPEGAAGVDADEIARLRGTCFMKLGDFAKAALAFGTRKGEAGSPPPEEER